MGRALISFKAALFNKKKKKKTIYDMTKYG